MEDIKTSLDKIVAKFNDSLTHSAPKKLSFDNLNDSLNCSGTVPKKRRFSQSLDDSKLNGSLNNSNTTLNTSGAAPPSPWESRRMKADLIEAKTRISKLKQDIDRQNKLRSEMETLYESKVKELKKQCDFSSNKILDMEKHMQTLRKREYSAKQEAIKMQSELNKQKNEADEKIRHLERTLHDTEDNMRLVQNSLENDLSEMKRHSEKIEMDLDFASDELEKVRGLLDDYKDRALGYDNISLQLEKEQQSLEQANERIKELENKIANYEDWKEITKNSQSRLLSIPEMQKELERLRANNKNLQDLLGNKLLLEEQVHDLKIRLEKEEGARSEAITIQVKLSHIEKELKEWVKIAQDHCLPNTLVSPMALRSRIEQLLQNDIITAVEKSSKLNDTKTMESDLYDYKQKCESYAKNIEDLNFALKRHKAFKERVQKKLLLVSRERDCYKQLLENFEKDLTLSNTNSAEISNVEAQLRCRIEMLEKTLVGYKEMCANLEKELTTAKLMTQNEQNCENSLESGYDHVKKELDTLRMENDRMRRRKEELELELEHRCLKGDFNTAKFKVIHLTKNPAAEAYENADLFVEKLQAEIERLKRRNKKLEDNEMTQVRLNETTNMTMNIKEINQLRSELDSTNQKMKKMKECYKSASMEFREVCYMLFGYRIDRIGSNTNYKLSSMFAESEDDYLNFRLNESNVLDMLETPYSITLKPFIESQLVGKNSLPVFLSTLTLELFQRSTITIS